MKHRIIIHLTCVCTLLYLNGWSQANAMNKVRFIKNEGQWPSNVKFESKVGDTRIRVTDSLLSFAKVRTTKRTVKPAHFVERYSDMDSTIEALVWNLKFMNANASSSITSQDIEPTKYNYLQGDVSNHKTNVPCFGQITYNNIYPNVDFSFRRSEGERLKYDVVIHPGGNINLIDLLYEGIGSLQTSGTGELSIATLWGTFTEAIPESYQMINGTKVNVSVGYTLKSSNSYGFQIVGNYDPAFDLIIDPLTLEWATFLQGAPATDEGDDIFGLDVDDIGRSYVVGKTRELALGQNLPTNTGVFTFPSTLTGNVTSFDDAFVARIAADATTLDYVTIFGSTPNAAGDFGTDIAGDVVVGTGTAPDIYITGLTEYETNALFAFPIVPASGATGGTSTDCFLVKLNNGGNQILNSRLVGGTNQDYPYAIDINTNGDAFIGGRTSSNNFPGAVVNNITNPVDEYKAFVCRVNVGAANTAPVLIYTRQFNVNSLLPDLCIDLKVDNNSNAYVLGRTASLNNFALNAFTPAPVFSPSQLFPQFGNVNCFVARLDAAGAVNYLTIIGSDGDELAHSIDIDNRNNPQLVYIAGIVDETNATGTFPTTNGFHNQLTNGYQAFIGAINVTLQNSIFQYSTLLGGNIPAGGIGIGLVLMEFRGIGIDADENGLVYFATTVHDWGNLISDLGTCVLEDRYNGGETGAAGDEDVLFGIINTNSTGQASLQEMSFWGSDGGETQPIGPVLYNDCPIIGLFASRRLETFPRQIGNPNGYNVFQPNLQAGSNSGMYVMKLCDLRPENLAIESCEPLPCYNLDNAIRTHVLGNHLGSPTQAQLDHLCYTITPAVNDPTCVEITETTSYTIDLSLCTLLGDMTTAHCIGEQTITFVIGNAPEPLLTLNQVTCNNTATITATALQGYVIINYQWSNGQNTSNVTITQSGNYTLTVTYASGCTATESIDVYFPQCCVGTIQAGVNGNQPLTFNDVLASQLISLFSGNVITTNSSVAINGTLTVDDELIFLDCPNIILGESAQITIENGATLSIQNSKLQACGNMWQGIHALTGSDIDISNGSIIQDAEKALFLEDIVNFYIGSSTFDNNLNSIFILQPNGSGGTATIEGSTFSNTAGSLLPPHTSETSNKGIEVWANDGIDIGPGNIFDGLKTGISLWLTNATVTECTFQNLVTEPLNPLNTGIGIYAQGDLGIPGYTPPFTNYTLNVYGMGKDAATPNFSNLRTGIMLRNMNTKEIANNFMNGVAYGVRAQLCHGGNLNINENRFANVSNTGVLFTNNLGAQMLIANNNLSGQKTSINPTGVHIAGFGEKVSNLIVGLNRFDRFTYGVRMNKVTGNSMDIGGVGAHIWNNDFYSTLSSSANNIHLTACERISISENYIEGNPASINVNPNSASGITNAKHNGVYLQSTANYWLRCNNFDNLSSAVYSFGSNPTGRNNITTNLMHRHFYGWNLRKFGLDGEVGTVGTPQTGNRNDFNDGQSSYYNGVQIWGHNNSGISQNAIFTLAQDGLVAISGTNGISPFTPQAAQSPLGECEAVPEGDLQFLIDDETYYQETNALSVITGTLAQTADPMFQEVVDFEARRRLYKTLEQDTLLVQSSSTFSNFFNQARFQTIGKLNEIENELALLSDSTVLQDSVQVAAIRQSIRTKRESIANYSMHETNEKEVLAIYEEKVLNATDQFTAAEQQLIAGLAHQCPLVAGNGVYLARSLYSLFGEDNEFDDAVNCEGYYKKEQTFEADRAGIEAQLRVFPNPAKEQTLVAYFVPATSAGIHSVSLKTIEGKEVFTQSILVGGSAITINLSGIASGLYFVELISNGAVLKTNKLTVQH